VRRAISIKHIVDVIKVAPTIDEVFEGTRDHEKLKPCYGKTFNFRVEGMGKKIALKDALPMIAKAEPTGLDGNLVSLVNPECKFKLFQDFHTNTIIFGRRIAGCSVDQPGKVKKCAWHHIYDLTARPYLGPTSLKHELAIMMAT
jgi:hypothetical protein